MRAISGMRKVRWAAVAVVASMTAAGCVSIPDSSGVGQASQVGVTDTAPQIINEAQGPVPGAHPESVVYGFYNAMLAYPPRPDVASEFLTPQAAGDWDPTTRVTVYDQPTLNVEGTSVIVTTHTAGHLDARGTWFSNASGRSSKPLPVHLRLVAGEWRIANPPAGLSVNTDFFSRHYKAFSLYFFDPSRTNLAPDPVYLPVGDTTATALVQDLLLGPTERMRKALYTAAAANTKLDVSVSVSSSGLAVVPLSSEILDMTSDDRQLFAAQLAWTLRQVDGIDRIAIRVDGGDIEIENAGSTFSTASFAGYDPAGLSGERRLFAFNHDGRLVSVAASGPTPLVGPIGKVDGGVYGAVEPYGQVAAIVLEGAHSVDVGDLPISPEGSVETWYSGASHLLRPSWDGRHVLWLVDQTDHGQRILAAHRGRVKPVAAESFGGTIVAFSVSRDGVRFAAIIEAEDGTRSLQIATIVRAPGSPPSLGVPQPVTNAFVHFTDLVDVAWESPVSLAVLAHRAGESLRPYNVAIDGSEIQPAGGFLPVSPTSIASGPTSDAPTAIGTKEGEIWVQRPDLQWTRAAAGTHLTSPLYAG
jgi:Lipoprotein LpqB beta-propeller domain/Sporulation and spore germination